MEGEGGWGGVKVLMMTHILARGRERDCVYRTAFSACFIFKDEEESRLGEAECVDGGDGGGGGAR